MRHLEMADARRMESRDMQEFGTLVQKRAKTWRATNTALKEHEKREKKLTSAQRSKLLNKIDRALKIAK